MSQEPNWQEIYVGEGIPLDMLEAELKALGVETVRTSVNSPLNFSGNIVPHGMYSLCVPAEQYAREKEVIDRLVREATGQVVEDVSAEAEAEEDFDVRGCAACGVFLHDFFASCPGCGGELVPAVELFAPDQAAPDRVIVATGTAEEMEALERRFREAGFQPSLHHPAGWKDSAVSLSWEELCARTREAESIARG